MMTSSPNTTDGDLTADKVYLWPTFAKPIAELADELTELAQRQQTNSPSPTESGFDLVSTDGGQNDQEHWWPIFEELRHLQDRIKIVLLECEQLFNSLTSSSVDSDFVEQNENVTVEQLLRAKIEELERKQKADQEEHRAKIDEVTKAKVAAEWKYQQLVKEHKALQTKMDEYQKEQQQNIIDALTEAQKGNVEHFSQLQEQQLNIHDRWDSAACARGLKLSEPERLIVQYSCGSHRLTRSVRSERPIPKWGSGIFYYEVTILVKEGSIHIGLATRETPLTTCIGYCKATPSYGYSSKSGTFRAFDLLFGGRPVIEGGTPTFGKGDVIGCGVNLATRQLIFTKNGRRLETADLFVDSAAELFPSVSLRIEGDEIEANFGPNFEYKI